MEIETELRLSGTLVQWQFTSESMANTVCFYSGLEDSPIDAAVATCREIEMI
jgi:hypothetical protein